MLKYSRWDWTGGENGYYKASDGRKFDYYLQEIE
jgi:hypothetical protein